MILSIESHYVSWYYCRLHLNMGGPKIELGVERWQQGSFFCLYVNPISLWLKAVFIQFNCLAAVFLEGMDHMGGVVWFLFLHVLE